MLLLVLLGLALLLVERLPGQPLSSLRSQLFSFLEPAYLTVAAPGQLVDGFLSQWTTARQLEEDNARLREQLARQAVLLQRFAQLRGENLELRGLLSTQSDPTLAGLVEVIGVDPDPARQMLIARRLRGQPVFVGQPVLDERGVMGRITQVGRHTLRIKLITDRLHSVPVRVDRTGIRAILSGVGHPQQLVLQFVPEKSDIRRGDLLTTSGLGQFFPAGYPVARVTSVRRNGDDQFLEVVAEPLAGLHRSRFLVGLRVVPASVTLPPPPPVTEAVAP